MRPLFTIPVVFAALVFAYGTPVASGAAPQAPAPAPDQHQHEQAPPAEGGMSSMPDMAGMMKMHQAMMAEMKAADAKLEQLIGQMNSAKGDAKVAAIATLVSELAHQQQQMHARMGTMHDHMMHGGGMMMKH